MERSDIDRSIRKVPRRSSPGGANQIIPGLVFADPESFESIGEETTGLLDITPARFFRRFIVRPKFRRKNQT